MYGKDKKRMFYRADILIEDLVRFSSKETSCEGIFVWPEYKRIYEKILRSSWPEHTTANTEGTAGGPTRLSSNSLKKKIADQIFQIRCTDCRLHQNVHPEPSAYVSFCASPHFLKKSKVVLNAVARDHSPCVKKNPITHQDMYLNGGNGRKWFWPVISGALPMAMASPMRVVSIQMWTEDVVRMFVGLTAEGLHVWLLSCIGSDTTEVEVALKWRVDKWVTYKNPWLNKLIIQMIIVDLTIKYHQPSVKGVQF